jgi:CRISPR/Cas system-associated exonuclease Cas4 (RecB family)
MTAQIPETDLARPDTTRRVITKSDWLAAQLCPAMGWFRLRATPVPPSEADRFRMEQGQEIGRLARQLYQDRILVSARAGLAAVDITQGFIAERSVATIFEAEFRTGPFVARADILRRHDNGWHVLEVKSSFVDTDQIDALTEDLAYTVMVLRRTGLHVVKASLVLLSRGYSFGDGPEHLFEVIDQTSEVEDRVAEAAASADNIAAALLSETSPVPVLVSACRGCDFFEDKCLGAGLDHTVLEIPGLHHTKLKRLSAEGIIELSRVPEDLELNERQERAKYAALSGNTVIAPGLTDVLGTIVWPCHYLDFETVATLLPLYGGHGCHKQVLTQFSIHHRESPEVEPRHDEYLADATKHCERELAERLIECLGDHGSIIVYSSFEQTRIEALQKAFPDLVNPLQLILNRIIDLLPIIGDHVCHPGFRGRLTIKKVLPVLVPELSYAGLDVADGDTAICSHGTR